jgi:hypothetical protein
VKIGGKQVPNWAVYGGIGVAVVGGVLWWRNRSAGSSTPSNATTAATNANLIDPATGIPYADETAGAIGSTGGYSGLGYGYPTSDITGSTLSSGTSFTTNAQWAQAVEAGLTGLGYDAQAVGSAIGKYLLSQPLTSDQVTIVQTAVAEYGPPPVGTFAIIAGGAAPPPPPSGGGGPGPGGGGWTPPPGGGGAAGRLAAPVGIHLTIDGKTGVRLAWGPVTGATGYVAQCKQGTAAGPTVNGPNHVGVPQADFGNLKPGIHYTALIWPSDAADPGGPGSAQPHTEFGFTTPK